VQYAITGTRRILTTIFLYQAEDVSIFPITIASPEELTQLVLGTGVLWCFVTAVYNVVYVCLTPVIAMVSLPEPSPAMPPAPSPARKDVNARTQRLTQAVKARVELAELMKSLESEVN
jgi:hypothetical protein